MYKTPIQLNKGFTLIEMLVSLSLFTIVITIAVGAFLSLIGGSQSVQSEQSVMTTLTFVMDSMTREIRTGTGYYCANSTFKTQESITALSDCSSGASGISFFESGSSVTGGSAKRIAYYYDSADDGTIFRRVGGNDPQAIVSTGIKVTAVKFFVTGTKPFSDVSKDTEQPTVTIVIEAEDDTGASTVLQTTVTQRELDL